MLLFAVSYQWIQVATKVFHADVLGIQVGSMMAFGQTDLAIWLSLVGLLALAVGMRLGLAGLPAVDLRATAVEIDALSLDRLWVAYAIAFIGKEGIRLVAGLVPGLTQALLAFGDLRWFFFFLFAYGALAQRRRYAMLTFAVALEVVFGFTGFFSAFKEVFFVLLIAYLTVRSKFGMRNAATVGVFIGAVVALGALWMTVRGDYRTYVSRGERAQVVHIDFLERLDRMGEMLMAVDGPALAGGVELLAERMAYVDYFSMVALHVPARLPFEEGALWKAAVLHVLTPRLFFSDKPMLLSDSELTMKYTGLYLASGEEGTSISLGYFAESYIDFGPVGMMVPILLVGVTWGLMYRYFLSRGTWVCFAFAAAVAVLMRANQFEIYSVKLIGGVLTTFIVFAIWIKWGLPTIVPWMRRKRTPAERRAKQQGFTRRTAG